MAKKVDDWFSDLADKAISKFGENTYIGDSNNIVEEGLYIPPLCMQYLVGQTTWPFHRYTFGAGENAAMKSTFTFELGRWFVESGGRFSIVDSEQKLNQQFMYSVIGSHNKNLCNVFTANTVEDWQKRIQFLLDYYSAKLKKIKAEDRIPILIGLDSLQGAESEDMRATIEKDGFAPSRGFAVNAAMIGKYYKASKEYLTGLPISWHTVSHLKEDMEGNQRRSSFMPKQYKEPGGVDKDYLKVLDLWFTRIGEGWAEHYYDEVDTFVEGREIFIKANKNQLGPDKKVISVNICWINDGEQRTWFDWNTSTAEILHDLQSGDAAESTKNKTLKRPHIPEIRDVCDIVVQRNRATSKRLNLEGVPLSVVGRKIHEDSQLVSELQKVLNIRVCPIVGNKATVKSIHDFVSESKSNVTSSELSI